MYSESKNTVDHVDIEKNGEEDEIVFIKGQYIISRDHEKYDEYDNTDHETQGILKLEKVHQLKIKYNIQDEKKLDRKVFLWVMLPFSLVSLIHYMATFDIAVVMDLGLRQELKIESLQYNVVSAVLFIPCVIFETLSNNLLRYIRPHFFISISVVLLGVVAICNAFVNSYQALVVCRVFNGLFQSNACAMYYIISNYYPNFKAQKMITLYSSSGTLGAVFLFLFSAIAQGIKSNMSWKWLYILEGIFFIICGIGLFFCVADFPEGASFLNDEETFFLVKKLEVYSGRSGYQIRISMKDTLKFFTEPKLIFGCIAYSCLLCCSYGYGYYVPQIIKSYTTLLNGNIFVLQMIPFIIALILANVVSYFSDKIEMRSPFVLVGIFIVMIGIILAKVNSSQGVAYTGLCLVLVGLSCIIPVVNCWVILNFGGHLRKNLSTATLISISSIGGIFSPFLFSDSQAPEFPLGLWFNFGALWIALICVLVYLFLIYRSTMQKQTQYYRNYFNSLTLKERTLMGDQSPLFRYLY